MLQNAALDVAIGLILMYLMLSLLCTVVNEYIATKLNLRSKALCDALQKLIDDPTLLKNFYEHGLITSSSQASGSGVQSLIQGVANGIGALQGLKNQVAPPPPAAGAAPTPAGPEAEHPSYLASSTVALALLGSLLKKTPGPLNITGITTAIDALTSTAGDPKIKDALKASLLNAGNDIDKLQQNIATWFDDSMDRLSGAYKRKMKWIAMLIGLAVAIGFNADSFKVATTLWNDPERRASTIAVATEIAKKPFAAAGQTADQKPPGEGAAPAVVPPAVTPPAAPTKSGDSGGAATKPTGEAKCLEDNKSLDDKKCQDKLRKSIMETEDALRSLPIGWDCPAKADESRDYWECTKQNLHKVTLIQILGWILTALALSLGAPFWFDTLNKFINLRGAGAKPVREDQK